MPLIRLPEATIAELRRARERHRLAIQALRFVEVDTPEAVVRQHKRAMAMHRSRIARIEGHISRKTAQLNRERDERHAAMQADRVLRQRWVVRYQWRRDRPRGPSNRSSSWRHHAAVPILFKSEAAAWDYLHAVGFKNFSGRSKPSATVESVLLKKPAQ